MTKEEIFQKVKKATHSVMRDLDIESIKVNAHLRDELGLDSVDAMSLIIALEEEFGIVIPDAKVKDMTSIEQVVSYIEDYLRKSS